MLDKGVAPRKRFRQLRRVRTHFHTAFGCTLQEICRPAPWKVPTLPVNYISEDGNRVRTTQISKDRPLTQHRNREICMSRNASERKALNTKNAHKKSLCHPKKPILKHRRALKAKGVGKETDGFTAFTERKVSHHFRHRTHRTKEPVVIRNRSARKTIQEISSPVSTLYG